MLFFPQKITESMAKMNSITTGPQISQTGHLQFVSTLKTEAMWGASEVPEAGLEYKPFWHCGPARIY